VVRSNRTRFTPATRTFQALRIFVNEELDELHPGAGRLPSAMLRPGGPPGGRVLFIRWKDRIVKNFLAERGKVPRARGICLRSHGPRPSFQDSHKTPGS
jgi:16S rRNA (cytosine1402-N4)-methyltransferase